MNQDVNYLGPVSALGVEDRSSFIWKCYAHVVMAILAFGAIEAYLFQSGIAERIAMPMLNNWWMVFGAFIMPASLNAAASGSRATARQSASSRQAAAGTRP